MGRNLRIWIQEGKPILWPGQATKVMQSFGSTSSWPSRDSLSSNHSFLFSESDQTEDDTDVFLSEGEGDGGGGAEPDRASPKPSPLLAPAVFGGRAGSRLRVGQDGRCPSTPSSVAMSPPVGVKTGLEGQTEGDSVFAQKCAELQGFVRPLLVLLNGLKKGKYDRGLSTFQQSVAMDRIQRIVGILQKPSMGDKYLHTLLQVEMMLKLWFPQISPRAPAAPALPPILAENMVRSAPPRWHRDQLHIPVKKRKLSWTDADSLAQSDRKRFQQERLEHGAVCARLEIAPAASNERGRHCEKEEGKETQGEMLNWPQTRLAPVTCPLKYCLPRETGGGGIKGNLAPCVIPPIITKGSPATQDALISSTTPLSRPLKVAPPGQQPERCQSEPITIETEAWASQTPQGRSLSLEHLTKPFSTPEQ
ncbi:hypothetical protein AAFF_G00238270 [Aldrovandia affinis]|uniref:Circadian-associated transcriptional repressor n=1 Tax=Aldrovandia affinis TaxID=143900 RepID=A0AAD7REW4_9TELE|nr:hypothetical protein AAFF_G00238270 [Aldrovandia affinis]